MSSDLASLIGLVKQSKLLSESERAEWLRKMDSMNEEQLQKLEDILLEATRINWKEEIPKYEAAVAEAERVTQQFLSTTP